MVRGELQPEPLRWYMKPVLADLAYDAISKDPFPTPQEAQVWFNLGDARKSAFVPLFIVDEEKLTVRAALLGEQGGEIFVSFPPTNFGQTRFLLEPECLDKIDKTPAQ